MGSNGKSGQYARTDEKCKQRDGNFKRKIKAKCYKIRL